MENTKLALLKERLANHGDIPAWDLFPVNSCPMWVGERGGWVATTGVIGLLEGKPFYLNRSVEVLGPLFPEGVQAQAARLTREVRTPIRFYGLEDRELTEEDAGEILQQLGTLEAHGPLAKLRAHVESHGDVPVWDLVPNGPEPEDSYEAQRWAGVTGRITVRDGLVMYVHEHSCDVGPLSAQGWAEEDARIRRAHGGLARFWAGRDCVLTEEDAAGILRQLGLAE